MIRLRDVTMALVIAVAMSHSVSAQGKSIFRIWTKFDIAIRCILVYSIGVFDGLGIITSFFAGLVHTAKGVTCSDSSLMDLSTAEECSGAVNYAKSFNSNASFTYVGSWSRNHQGCVILDSGYIFFITQSTGGENSTSTSICRKGSTYFGVQYSLLGK